MKEVLNIAQISGTHHLKGVLKASSIFEDIDLLVDKKVMLIEERSQDRKILTVEDVGRMNSKRITIKFKEINSLTQAKDIDGYKVYIRREELGDRTEDEYYLSDLIDMQVETTEGEILGKIREVFTTAAHDIYVINEGKEEIMIPAVDEFVKKIDFENDKVVVQLIEGLID